MSSCVTLSATACGWRHSCVTACGLRLMAWLHLRWIDGATAAVVLFVRPGSPMKERLELGPSDVKTSILAIMPKRPS
ncbi:hypothetical protein TNCV_3910521 [Trichonephila clavipes]|nr:hypothetical protein TNCV_3910521 [Trichonephila clavipes]